MSDVLTEQQEHVLFVTLNKINKHNAFDDVLLAELQLILDNAAGDSTVRVIVIKANGRHFSAGADVAWMQRMAEFSEDENLADAKVLAKLMYTLHQHPKPTIAMVQGAAFGGGAGLVAACDIAIASSNASFCFSEVKLGLIPAVISPYVIKAIGERPATALFISAETIDAARALELQLIHHCVSEDELLTVTRNMAKQIATLAPNAVRAAKSLTHHITGMPITEELGEITAALIAQRRVSAEGQKGLQAFLNKETPNWD